MSGTIQLGQADAPEVGTGRGQVPGRGLFARLGRTVTAHPGRVAAGWVLVVVSLMAISAALGQSPPPSGEAAQLPAGYESARAQAAMDKAFGAPSSDATAVLVISRLDGHRLTGRDLAVADHAIAGLTGVEGRRHREIPRQRAGSVGSGPTTAQLAPLSFRRAAPDAGFLPMIQCPTLSGTGRRPGCWRTA